MSTLMNQSSMVKNEQTVLRINSLSAVKNQRLVNLRQLRADRKEGSVLAKSSSYNIMGRRISFKLSGMKTRYMTSQQIIEYKNSLLIKEASKILASKKPVQTLFGYKIKIR